MNKNIFIILLAQIFNMAYGNQEKGKKIDKPNVIIFFTDDLGYGDLTCYGHPSNKTPNIDKMASEGMKFTQFYVSSSLCSPSRAALLTGRLPIRTGAYGKKRHVFFCDANGGIPENELMLGELLKSKGYKTACIGKWHLGHKLEYLPTSQGFDYFFGIPYSNDMSPATNPNWDGASHCCPLPLMKNTTIIEEEPNQDSLTIRYTEEAIKFIKKNKNDNFFLYLPYTSPHTPLHVSDNYRNSTLRGLYGDVLSELDWSVGEILNFLVENRLDKNTFVLFTSDNGPWLMRELDGGSSGLLKNGKGTTWEGGIRVPAIAWWPGKIDPHQVNQSVLSTMDVFTTIADMVNYSLPADRIYDGDDISSVLFNGVLKPEKPSFFYKGEELFAVRKGPWKIHLKTLDKPFGETKISDWNPPLLFNIEEDPEEKYNRNSEYPKIVSDLLNEAKKHINNLEIAEPQFDR